MNHEARIVELEGTVVMLVRQVLLLQDALRQHALSVLPASQGKKRMGRPPAGTQYSPETIQGTVAMVGATQAANLLGMHRTTLHKWLREHRQVAVVENVRTAQEVSGEPRVVGSTEEA